MAASFTAAIQVLCWKTHECVGCGAKFRYLFSRNLHATDLSMKAAEERAERIARKSIEEDVDFRPCPTCGRFQPDMVAKSKRIQHLWCTGLALFFCIVVMVLGRSYSVPDCTPGNMGFVASGILLLAAFVQALIALGDPNSSPLANLIRAKGEINFKFQLITEGDLDQALAHPPRKPFRSKHLLGLFLMVTAAFPASLAGMMKADQNWQSNECVPEVVGTGETCRLYFRGPIDTLKNHWDTTTASAIILESDNRTLMGRPLAIDVHHDTWETSIVVARHEGNSHPAIWMDLNIPGDSVLVGQKLTIEAEMEVVYPSRQDSGYEEKTKLFRQSFVLTPAPARAQETYLLAFWTGIPIAMTLFLVGGTVMIQLTRSLAATAHPTTVEMAVREEIPQLPIT